MIRLAHYNDGKEKPQSHEVTAYETPFYDVDHDVSTHDIFGLVGYGETKEEALEDFKKKFSYIMDECRAFEKMLFETNVIEDDMVDVDFAGHEIK